MQLPRHNSEDKRLQNGQQVSVIDDTLKDSIRIH